jgi:hypothetical protein
MSRWEPWWERAGSECNDVPTLVELLLVVAAVLSRVGKLDPPTNQTNRPNLQAAGKPLYRSAFTTGAADGSPFFNPFDLDMKNVANTGACRPGGRGGLGSWLGAGLRLGVVDGVVLGRGVAIV